jgi:hypothetical protein
MVEGEFRGNVFTCLLPHEYRKQPSWGWGRVIDRFRNEVPAEEVITITFANGKQVSCTRSHIFYLKDGTAKCAFELTPEDELLEAIGHG